MTDDNEKPSWKRLDKKKSSIYEKEQKEILEKLYTITGVTDTNKTIAYYDIENDQKKIDEIMAMKDDIYKYFRATTSKYVKITKEYISLIKLVLKQMNIKFLTMAKIIYRKKEAHKTTLIYLL